MMQANNSKTTSGNAGIVTGGAAETTSEDI